MIQFRFITLQGHIFTITIAEPITISANGILKMAANNPALEPDQDHPENPAHEFAQFGAGCFWGVELAFQRVVGVVKTEVGYSQGHVPDPNYRLVCSGTTNHVEVIRVQFDPQVCPYTNLLSVFWGRHDPTTLNRQVWVVMWVRNIDQESTITMRAQARLARESMEAKQLELKDRKIVTEILPAKRFYRAEEYHQQYLEKGGGKGLKQSG
ncbi:hypothetical protein Patl1_18197 [Pistacia atlantica]|uniref:Uncharacterized protein n=1 Tax=Pistacia atlantica TaxID=434234 RepID=A0ACC1BXH1_9ROSI|nr:hypothetical protein Patl1_18197 [Pistacia atlantica]